MTLIAKKTAASEGVRVLMLSSVHQLAQSRRDDNQHKPSPEWGDMNRYRAVHVVPSGLSTLAAVRVPWVYTHGYNMSPLRAGETSFDYFLGVFATQY